MRTTRGIFTTAAAALGILMLIAVPAAAAPANDDVVDAIGLTLPASTTTDTSGATSEGGEPVPSCGAGAASVWYSYSAAEPTALKLSTFGSKFDTILAVYTGTGLGDLAEIGCNDDDASTGSLQSRLNVSVPGGSTAFIQVTGYLGASGKLTLGAQAPSIPNDEFAFATVVPALPFTDTLDTTEATLEAGEPDACGTMLGRTVWYRLTSPTAIAARVDTLASDFDTVINVYTGSSLGSLSAVTCNDQFGSDQSLVQFDAAAGETYHVQVGGYVDDAGELVIDFDLFDPPANDDFVDAIALDIPETVTTSTIGATTEVGEPEGCAGIGSTLWYTVTPEQDGRVRIDTFGSNYDTALAVYTGSDVGSLTEVACNDDFDSLQSRVDFPVSAGTTYHVQLGGFFGDFGDAELHTAFRSGTNVGPVTIFTDDGLEICALDLCIPIL